jgi:hypothetical protein
MMRGSLLIILGLACCSGPQVRNGGSGTGSGSGTSAGTGAGTGTAGSRPVGGDPQGKIEGDVERMQRRKHMKIWGQVERIRSGKHGQLPELTTESSGGEGDPVTKIRNQTSFKLTIWFAGKCSHQVEVPAGTDVTAIFCAGKYNLAAMVDDRAFLPLVREDQDFEKGVLYKLEFFVQKRPSR